MSLRSSVPRLEKDDTDLPSRIRKTPLDNMEEEQCGFWESQF